jgi:hypothetical protein
MKIPSLFLVLLTAFFCSCKKLNFNNYIEFVVINESSHILNWVQVYALDDLGNKSEIHDVDITRFESVPLNSESEIRRIYFNKFSEKGRGDLRVMCQYIDTNDTLSTGLGSYKHFKFVDDFAAFDNLNKIHITVTDKYGPQGSMH